MHAPAMGITLCYVRRDFLLNHFHSDVWNGLFNFGFWFGFYSKLARFGIRVGSLKIPFSVQFSHKNFQNVFTFLKIQCPVGCHGIGFDELDYKILNFLIEKYGPVANCKTQQNSHVEDVVLKLDMLMLW